jgi:hypothetical protein
VVTGRGGQLAVQCDGDRWQGADAYRAELDLQRDLERCGWPFHRIRQAELIVDPVGCLDTLCGVLAEHGIFPRGDDPTPHEPADPVIRSDDRPPVESAAIPNASVLEEFDWNRPETAPFDGVVQDEFAADADTSKLDLTDPARWVKRPKTESAPVESDSRGSLPGRMGDYTAFTAELASPAKASHRTIVEDLCAVVAVEGPVTGLRLRAAYVSAANTRERDNIRNAIDRALHAAVAHGRLLVDDPLDLGDPGLMAYRTPGQPLSQSRVLGPRRIEQVPPRELAEVMVDRAQAAGWDNRADLFRAVINAFGQTRLTENATLALERVEPLARSLTARTTA